MQKRQNSMWVQTPTRRDLKSAALLFSFAVILPHVHYLAPLWLWEGSYWAVSYVRALALYASAALVIPFGIRGFKVAFTGLAVVTAVTIMAMFLRVPYVVGIPLSAPLWLMILYSAWRASVAPRVGGDALEGYTGAYIVRVPIHSWVGVCQALLMPWHHARYETRVVVQGDEAWYLHKGRFRKLPHGGGKLIEQGDADPVGRELSFVERGTLDHLVGKRSILGFRDCRRFEL